jgi:hypothetical protein
MDKTGKVKDLEAQYAEAEQDLIVTEFEKWAESVFGDDAFKKDERGLYVVPSIDIAFTAFVKGFCTGQVAQQAKVLMVSKTAKEFGKEEK